jgi:hypothetical protein
MEIVNWFFDLFSTEEFSELFTIFILSIFKFGFGLFAAVVLDANIEHRIFVNLLGGLIGILKYTFFSAIIKHFYLKIRYRYSKPVKFTKWNRGIITFKKRFGIIGIALISPIIITIPIGIVLMLQITNKKWKIILFMFLSCILWAMIFFSLFHFFGFAVKF